MKSTFLTLFSAIIIFVLTACTETTDGLGTTITPYADTVSVFADTIGIKSKSVRVDSVFARSKRCYIGRTYDRETESYVLANFQNQLTYSSGMKSAIEEVEEDDSTSLDTAYMKNGVPYVDSCVVYIYFNKLSGDDNNLMKMRMYELNKPLGESSAVYSNFDIENGDYIRSSSEGGIAKNVSWTAMDYTTTSNDQYESGYYRTCITFKDAYLAKDGTVYDNYGNYILSQIWNNEFMTASDFVNDVCPGFYFKHLDGIGTLAEISSINMVFPLRFRIEFSDSTEADSTYTSYVYLSSTPETSFNTFISQDTTSYEKFLNDEENTYIKSPVGLFTEIELPVLDIMEGNESDSLNSVYLSIPRVNSDNDNLSKYNIGVPENLLLVEEDSVKGFFEQKNIYDNKRSYLATLSGNSYTFSNICILVSKMYEAYTDGMATDADWATKHPNWNKVLLVPVETQELATSTVATAVYHCFKPTSTKLVKGTGDINTGLYVSYVFSKFSND